VVTSRGITSFAGGETGAQSSRYDSIARGPRGQRDRVLEYALAWGAARDRSRRPTTSQTLSRYAPTPAPRSVPARISRPAPPGPAMESAPLGPSETRLRPSGTDRSPKRLGEMLWGPVCALNPRSDRPRGSRDARESRRPCNAAAMRARLAGVPVAARYRQSFLGVESAGCQAVESPEAPRQLIDRGRLLLLRVCRGGQRCATPTARGRVFTRPRGEFGRGWLSTRQAHGEHLSEFPRSCVLWLAPPSFLGES
jgi:hypothetical protein